MPDISKIYICFDGDRIGEKIQFFFMNNDIEAAREFGSRFDNIVAHIVHSMAKFDIECVFRGGDSLVFFSEKEVNAENIIHVFGDVTFSVGIGHTLELASLSLVKAKALGRAQLVRNSW